MKKTNKLADAFRRWNEDERDFTLGLRERPSLDADASEQKHEPPEEVLFSKSAAMRELRLARILYVTLACISCITIIGVLFVTMTYMPAIGDANDPTNNIVAEKYLSDGLTDTGAVNAVAGMILDYRAFDTLGESFVLFTATCTVIILMRSSFSKRKERHLVSENKLLDLSQDSIVSFSGRMLIPFILLFGTYIVLNGHLSPGGGFSGGAVLGSAFIVYASIFGFDAIDRFLSSRVIKICTCSSLGFYCLAKSYSFFTGANNIESIIPKGTPGAIISAGLILPLDIAVGIVVACTMYSFYSLFRKGRV